MDIFKHIANFELKIKEQEEILNKAKAIRFNEHFIEVVGSFLILKKGTSSKINKLLNPSLADIEISETEFNELLIKLKEHREDVLFVDSGIVPKSTVRLNIKELINNSLCFMIFDDTIYFDKNIVLTTDVAEFRGSGVFSSKDLILKVDQVSFEDILEKLK